MFTIKNLLRNYARSRSGATAMQYGLIAALIGVSIIGGANTFGKTTNAQLQCTSEVIGDAETIRDPKKHMDKCVRQTAR